MAIRGPDIEPTLPSLQDPTVGGVSPEVQAEIEAAIAGQIPAFEEAGLGAGPPIADPFTIMGIPLGEMDPGFQSFPETGGIPTSQLPGPGVIEITTIDEGPATFNGPTPLETSDLSFSNVTAPGSAAVGGGGILGLIALFILGGKR
jgi:hypothetical protein